MTRPPLKPFTRWLAWALATTGGLGDHVPAPGTFAGSLPAASIWWALGLLLPTTGSMTLLSLAVLPPLVVLAVWASAVEATRRGANDPGPVVVDEVAGQWLCLLIAQALVTGIGRPAGTALLAGVGFVVFRVLDVVKPWPIRPLERIKGGAGIVADDLAAGAVAGLLVGLAWRFLS